MKTSVRLLAPEEVAEFLGVSRRRVLQLPLTQVRLGDRTIRYRLSDLYSFAGIEDPNAESGDRGREG
jgi:predicted DNA-binding transcriptional regulator AlpA